MKQLMFRLICFILLVTQLSQSNFAQVEPEPPLPAQESIERIIATVKIKNNEAISSIKYRDLLFQLATEPGVMLYSLTAVDFDRALRLIINQRLIFLSAVGAEKDWLVQPTETEVNEQILSLSRFFPSTAEFENRIRVAGFLSINDENFKRKIAERLITEKYINYRFRSRVAIDPKEEESYYRNVFVPELQRRNSGVIIPELQKQRPQIRQILTEMKVAGDIEDFLLDIKSNVDIVVFEQVKPTTSAIQLPKLKPEQRPSTDLVNQPPAAKSVQNLPNKCELSPNNFRPSLDLDYLEKHLVLCRTVDNKAAVAIILRLIGNVRRFQTGGTAAALEAFQESLTLSESLGDKAGMISAMWGIGDMYRLQRNAQQSSEYVHKALALSEEFGDKRLIAQSFLHLAAFHQTQSNYDQSLVYLEKELKIHEELGDRNKLVDVLFRIGINYRVRDGDLSRSAEYLQKSLNLGEQIGQKSPLRTNLRTIGSIYQEQGYYSQALDIYARSLKLSEEFNDKVGISIDLSSIASIYQLQGDSLKAIEYYQRVLKLQETLLQEMDTVKQGNSAPILSSIGTGLTFIGKDNLAIQVAVTLNNIGTNYLELNNYDLAMEYFQKALQIEQAHGERNRSLFTLKRLGLLHFRLRNYPLAREYYHKILPSCEQNVDNLIVNEHCVAALSNIGYMWGLEGNSTKGLEFAERASILSRKLGQSYNSLQSYRMLGDAYRALGQLDKARTAFERAISIFESNSAKIINEAHRLTFIERTEKRPFDLYIDVLMQLHKQRPTEGYDALALQASERFRARLLVELLNEARANIRQGVEPKLLAQEKALQQQLNERAAQQTRLLTGKNGVEQSAALQKEIDALTVEFQQTKAQIRLNSPRYAALTQPQPLTAGEIQRDLLDADTVLLQYALGVERSYLWVVTPTTLKSYEFPNRSEIENDVLRIVSLLNDGKRWASDEKINAEYAEAAALLSRKLLPPSVLSQLKGKRLAIVSDGALQYLPFGALPIESKTENKSQKTNAVPLAVEYEIVILPSASALAVQRRETANRKPSAKSIAIFADPVFSENDERVAAVKTNQSKVNQKAKIDLNRLLLERAFYRNRETNEPLSIARLPFTRKEAEGIFETAPSGASLKALDFEANRNNVLKSDLSGYRIVHFATHGLLNSEHPELSGIVLSLVNEQGQSVDGFLRLNEIYNMTLSADLVVLSACQTALGKEIRGEGLIGLTRGFMYAGSSRVVASLWKVDDVATAELMKLFYQKMLKEQMRPAAALRAAKVEMLKQKRWNAPFYWAAFEIQGEWR